MQTRKALLALDFSFANEGKNRHSGTRGAEQHREWAQEGEARLGQILAANFGAGVVAGSLAAAVTTPLDVAKTRVQIEVRRHPASILPSFITNALRSGGCLPTTVLYHMLVLLVCPLACLIHAASCFHRTADVCVCGRSGSGIPPEGDLEVRLSHTSVKMSQSLHASKEHLTYCT